MATADADLGGANMLPPPPARSEGGLYGASSQRAKDGGRWLWFGGLSENTDEGPNLNDWIEGQRGREGSAGSSQSTFTVHRYAGGAWVHFTGLAFAQSCLQGLNGRDLPSGGSLRVRYAGFYEDTSGAPTVQYVKRPLPSKDAKGQVRPRPGATNETSPGAATKQPRPEEGGNGTGPDGKRLKAADGSASAVSSNGHGGTPGGPPPPRTAPTPSAGPSAASAAPSMPPPARGPQWDGGTWTNADVLRLALRSAAPYTSAPQLTSELFGECTGCFFGGRYTHHSRLLPHASSCLFLIRD